MARFTVAAAFVALLASAGHAGDLTGTWKGSFRCTIEDAQGQQKLSSRSVSVPEPGVSTLEIVQPDGPDTAALHLLIDAAVYSGFVLDGSAASGGTGAFLDCGANPDASGYLEIRHFRWKTSADAGAIVWRGFRVGAAGEVGRCRGSWRRVSREEPKIAASCD
jgi:hypothetical protein